jgi:hypothetical protein
MSQFSRVGITVPTLLLRRQEPLTPKDQDLHQQGLISILRELHDDLDRAVFAAYGWNDLAEHLVGRPGATTRWPEKPEDQQRAAEEAQGHIRWLRPDYQAPQPTAEQTSLTTDTPETTTEPHPAADTTATAKPYIPADS